MRKDAILIVPFWDWKNPVDISRYRRNLTLDNSSGDISGVTSQIGPATTFSGDATNDRIDIGSIPSTDPLSFADGAATGLTVAFYAKLTSGVTTNWPRVIDKSNGGGYSNGWGIECYDTGSNDILNWGSDGSGNMSVTVTGLLDTWAFWILTSRGSGADEGEIYRNGVDLGAGYGGGGLTLPFPSTTTNAAIGNWNHTTDRMLRNPIGLLYVWNKWFPPVEARLLSANPFGPITPRPLSPVVRQPTTQGRIHLLGRPRIAKPHRAAISRNQVHPKWHWFWDKCVEIWAFDERSGDARSLKVQDTPLIKSGSNEAWQIAPKRGWGAYSPASGTSRWQSAGVPDRLRLGWPVTFGAFYYQNAARADWGNIWGVRYDDADSDPYDSYVLAIAGTPYAGQYYLGYNTDGTQAEDGGIHVSSPTASAKAGDPPFWLMGCIEDNEQRIWVGDLVNWAGRTTTSISDPTYDSTAPVETGVFGGTSVLGPDGTVLWGFIANQVFTTAERKMLQEDPFGPITPMPLSSLGFSVGDVAIDELIEGFQWYNDDGDKGAATADGSQDAIASIAVGQKRRLRMIWQAPGGGQPQLEEAIDGTEDWNKVIE